MVEDSFIWVVLRLFTKCTIPSPIYTYQWMVLDTTKSRLFHNSLQISNFSSTSTRKSSNIIFYSRISRYFNKILEKIEGKVTKKSSN